MSINYEAITAEICAERTNTNKMAIMYKYLAKMPHLDQKDAVEVLLSIIDAAYSNVDLMQQYYTSEAAKAATTYIQTFDSNYIQQRLKDRNLLWVEKDMADKYNTYGTLYERLNNCIKE